MSSSKHLPNPRKRPISEVDAEFPSLPMKSFEATIEFAKKSQEALQSVGKGLSSAGFSGTSSLFLPLISPNQLQHRFDVGEDDSVFVMVRKSYPLLKQEVDSLNVRKYSGIYVRGPVGVGKSYLLYLLAAEYRLNRERYRVTYINDCALWRDVGNEIFLRELVTTFYNDTVGKKYIVEWCKAVSRRDKAEKMMKMIDSIVKYVHKNNLEWILIFDQHNALFNPSIVKEFPFNLINAISRKMASNIKVVISASANNEGYPTEMQGWHTHDISSHGFDEEEFQVWCDHYSLEDNTKVNHESDEANDALYWTGGVPYELFLLWKQPIKGLIEKTHNYRKQRLVEMRFHHGNFYDKLSEEKKDHLKECISRMALKMTPPEGLEGMDRQLFDIIKDDETGTEIITALNPVARRALLGYHGKDTLIRSLTIVTELVLIGSEYTNAIKGKISEIYITTLIEISSLFTFKFRKVRRIGFPDDVPEIKRIEIKSVVHFLKNSLPVKTSLNKNLSTLFVPESPTYPRFDFFIWDSTRQVLMGFQVTVKNPISKHSKLESSRAWELFCFGKEKQTPMELYWVAPKRCVGKETGPVWDDSIILFEDLSNDFPALGNLSL